MRALLRPAFVLGLSIAVAGANVLGSSSVALAAGTKPTFTSLSVPSVVNQGDKPVVTGTFTDPDAGDQHTVQVFWGDGSADFYTLVIGDRGFSVQKSVGYPGVGVNLSMQVMLSDGSFSVSRFPSITVNNVAPSFTSFSLSTTDVAAGSAVTATGTFDDPGTADTHTVSVNWGDSPTNTSLSLARRVWTFTTPTPHTYTVGGTFTVTATVTDNNGGSAVATATVIVRGAANQAPSVVSFGVAAGLEGAASTMTLTFSDADASDTHTVSLAWGDASSSVSVSLDSTVTTYSTTHVYADTGSYQVVLTLADSAGNSVSATATVSPTNVAPTLGALTLAPASVVDHQTLTVSADFADPGTADTFTLTLDWGDLTSSTQSLVAGTRSFSATHAYAAAGPVTITATVTDRDNGKGSSSARLDVLPSNHVPADLTLGTTTVLEGGSTTLTVSFSDAEASDTHTVTLNWGDNSTEMISLAAGATTTGPTHTYLETGSYAVAVTVTDGGGLSVAGGTTVVVGNVAPSIGSLTLSPSSVKDHETVTLNGSFSDPGTADTFTVSFDWGDSSATSTVSLAAGARSFTASHAYSAAGTYVVTVTVSDRDNGVSTQTSSVVVGQSNRAPSSLSLVPTVNGSSVVVSATFADPDPLDAHTVTISWGNETLTSNLATTLDLTAGATSFLASHGYASSGTYTVNATVTDPSGASTSATVQVVVKVSAGSPAELLDQMKMLVQSFELDRNTERWLIRRIDELKNSLSSGNAELCHDIKTLAKIHAYGSRSLSSDQWAAVMALAEQLEAAAQCPAASARQDAPKKPRVTPVTTPKRSDEGNDDKDTAEKEKAEKVKADKAEKVAKAKSANADKDKHEKTERKATDRSERSD